MKRGIGYDVLLMTTIEKNNALVKKMLYIKKNKYICIIIYHSLFLI